MRKLKAYKAITLLKKTIKLIVKKKGRKSIFTNWTLKTSTRHVNTHCLLINRQIKFCYSEYYIF